MHDAPIDISRDDLIAFAKSHRYAVTEAKLVRWHKAGLLPRPTKKYLGYGKGSESFYPIIAREQLLVLCAALDESRSLEWAKWCVWCAGFSITPHVRSILLDALDSILLPVAHQLDSAATRGSVIHRARYGRTSTDLRPIQTTLGHGRFPDFMRAGLALVAGKLGVPSSSAAPALALVLEGVSAANANPKLRPALTAEHGKLPAGAVAMLGFCDLTTLRAVLVSAPDAELERGRDECRLAWEWIRSFAPSAPMCVPPLFYLLWFHLRFGYAPSRRFIEEFTTSPEWPTMRDEFSTAVNALQAATLATKEHTR